MTEVTWQGFMIANLAGLLGVAFFLGKLSSRVENLEKSRPDYQLFSEHLQRLRSAYHQMAGFMQLHHEEWKPYDFGDKP